MEILMIGWVTIWLIKLWDNGKIPIHTDEPLTLNTQSSTDSYLLMIANTSTLCPYAYLSHDIF